ncbi:mucin-6-like isoform X2 [Nilaparvata lugens]|uniref:mucin-6-like isoform X2 n=1 Tax=Nilaparvata lugens TaxID=108931 RepID=UPI00193CD088|nr:mucin-6-like isoform X2 [Nilaparvata lugens]
MLPSALFFRYYLFGLLQILFLRSSVFAKDYGHIETWHPLRERPMISRVVLPMRPAIPFNRPTTRAGAQGHATNKRLQVEPSPSNKIEVFAPAPPSILGSFSDFGHATVKAREPARMKKKPVHAEQQAAEASPAIGLLLPPPPVHENEANYGFQQQDETPAAAYYFEASLRPPPRDSAINIIPPPHSSNLPPNTYYFDNPHSYHSRFPVTHSHKQQGDFFFGQSTSAFRTTLPTVPPYESPFRLYQSDAYSHASTRLQPPSTRQVTNYYSQNPFGDINLSSRRPEFKLEGKQPAKDIPVFQHLPSAAIQHLPYIARPVNKENQNEGKVVFHQYSHVQRPVFEDNQSQPVAKDVFQQLSHLGRPFKNPQNTQSEYSHSSSSSNNNNNIKHNKNNNNINQQQNNNPYLTTVSSSIQFEDDKRLKVPSQSFHAPPPAANQQSDVDSYSYNENPHKLIPLSVTTVDIPSDTVKTGTVLSSVQPYLEYQEQKQKPLTYNDAPVRNRRPQVDIKTYQTLRDDTRPFLPTPATDVEPFIREPVRGTPSSDHEDQLNEVHVPNRGIYSAVRKPTDETPLDDLTTTFYKVSSRKPVNPLKHRRRRPTEVPSTATTVLQEIEHEESLNSIPNGIYSNLGNTLSSVEPQTESEQENYPVTTPQPPKRRKKPNRHRNRVHSNYFKTTLPPEPETTQHVLYDYSTAVITDAPEITNPHTHNSADIYSNTQPIDDYTRYKDYSTQDSIAGTQNIYPTQPVSSETANSIEEDEATENFITTTLATTTTSTTTTQAPLPSSTASYRTRVRNKYGNNTRPRFSVKEYKERINRGSSSTTIAPSAPEETETEIPKVRVKYPTRNRGQYKASSSTAAVNDDDFIHETTTEIIRKYKPRVRYNYKTSTTTPKPSLQLDSPSTTTERVNTFKPSGGRYKAGTGKYYSRYRTSTTKAPDEESDDSSPAASKPIRTKGVFSAKRRPFPLRSTVDPDADADAPTQESRRENEIDQVLTTVMTKKVDDATTTTIISGTVQGTSAGPTGEEAYTVQRVSDLTSSPSNMYQPNGFRKGLSPASRRTVPQITIATDDPILPLEAFFQTWSNNKEKRNSR